MVRLPTPTSACTTITGSAEVRTSRSARGPRCEAEASADPSAVAARPATFWTPPMPLAATTRTPTPPGTTTTRLTTPTRTSTSAGEADVAPGAVAPRRSSRALPTPSWYDVVPASVVGVQVCRPAQLTGPVVELAATVTTASRMPSGASAPALRPDSPAATVPSPTTASATPAATASSGPAPPIS